MRHQMSALVHWLYKSNKPQLQFPIQIHFFGGSYFFIILSFPPKSNTSSWDFQKKRWPEPSILHLPCFSTHRTPGPKNLRLVALVIVSDEGEAIAMQGILSKSQMIRTIICISFEGCISSWKRWHSGSHHCHCCSLFVCFCVFNVGRRRQLEISWGGDLESSLCEERRLMALEFHAPMSNKLPNKGMLKTWNIYEISLR